MSNSSRLIILGYLLGAMGCSHAQAVPFPSSPATETSPDASGRALSALANQVDALGSDGGKLDQATLAKLLEKLAQNMEPVSHAAHLRVHEVAQRLAGAPANSLLRPGLVKQGLDLILKGLVPFEIPPARAPEYRQTLQALAQSTAAIQDLLPLDAQRPRTAAALRAAVDAIFVARAGEPPFGEAENIDTPPVPLGPMDAELAQARGDISKLAEIKTLDAAPASGRALASLADVLAAADRTGKAKSSLDEARFQATRLERGDRTVRFGQAGWIRAGVTSLLDGLDTLQHGPANQPSAWSQVARTAVVHIDERSSLAFQRAAIQDALRATVDAFAIIAERAAVCAEPK